MEHVYIIGRAGTGKSTFLKQRTIADIHRGDGVLFVDPTGHDIDDLLHYIPRKRRKDTILFDPGNFEHPIAWNPLEDVSEERRPFVASAMLDSFKDAWGYAGAVTPTLDQYLYNSIAALIEAGETLIGIKFLLTSKAYREEILARLHDPFIKDFFADYGTMTARERRDDARSTLNKVGLLISDSRIRHTLGQRHSAFSMPDVLSGRILLARLPQGKLGVQKTAILGSLLLSQFHQAVLETAPAVPFHVYVDQCHHFGASTLIEMLSNAHRYGVQLTLCHQYLEQLRPNLRAAALGNSGERVVFAVSKVDAQKIDEALGHDNVLLDLSALPLYRARQFRGDLRPRNLFIQEALGTLYPRSASDIRTHSIRNLTRPRESVAKAIERNYKFT